MSVTHTDGPIRWLQPKKHALHKMHKLMKQFWDNVDTVTVPSTVPEAGIFQRTLVQVFLDLFRNGKRTVDAQNPGIKTWVQTIKDESLLDTWTLSDEWYKFLIDMEYESRTRKDIVVNNSVEKAHLFKQRVEKSYLIFKFGAILTDREALQDYEMDTNWPTFQISDEYLMRDFCHGTAKYYNDYMKSGSYKSIETGHVEDPDKQPISLKEQRRIMDLVARYLTQVGRLVHQDQKHHKPYLRACLHNDTQGLSTTAGVPNPFFVSL